MSSLIDGTFVPGGGANGGTPFCGDGGSEGNGGKLSPDEAGGSSISGAGDDMDWSSSSGGGKTDLGCIILSWPAGVLLLIFGSVG